MAEIHEHLSLFFDKIKGATFWDRTLPWRWVSIRALSYEAYGEYRNLMKELEQYRVSLDGEKTTAAQLRSTVSVQTEVIKQGEKELAAKQNEITGLREKIDRLEGNVTKCKESIATLKEQEANERKQYDASIATLNNIQNRIEKERKEELDERHRTDVERIESLRKNWSEHQRVVREMIKGICQRHAIEYVEKPPFKGNPDNTIRICGEYVVFDAKSPGTEELEGFYKYIQAQAEGIKKYTKQEGVKRDVFLVVPSNAVDVIRQFSFNMGDYSVYVVTVDALEPIVLALKKIEAYEFAEELTPEERENICRIIGKFAHVAKRRIQIDNFFVRQFLDVLTNCETDMPSDVLEKAVEFERAEKLNPPIEKRAKQILTNELIGDATKIQREAEAKGLVFPDNIQEKIRTLPLYEEDKKEGSDHEIS